MYIYIYIYIYIYTKLCLNLQNMSMVIPQHAPQINPSHPSSSISTTGFTSSGATVAGVSVTSGALVWAFRRAAFASRAKRWRFISSSSLGSGWWNEGILTPKETHGKTSYRIVIGPKIYLHHSGSFFFPPVRVGTFIFGREKRGPMSLHVWIWK